MIRISLFVFSLCISVAASAQIVDDSASVQRDTAEVFEVVDKQPEFPGNLMKYLGEQIKYPKSAQLEKLQGRVIVKFIVDEQGYVTSAGIERSAGAALDMEALRVVRGMPRWKPAYVDGRPVKSYFRLPLSFKL